jgi:hypothetical protein
MAPERRLRIFGIVKFDILEQFMVGEMALGLRVDVVGS